MQTNLKDDIFFSWDFEGWKGWDGGGSSPTSSVRNHWIMGSATIRELLKARDPPQIRRLVSPFVSVS